MVEQRQNRLLRSKGEEEEKEMRGNKRGSREGGKESVRTRSVALVLADVSVQASHHIQTGTGPNVGGRFPPGTAVF